MMRRDFFAQESIELNTFEYRPEKIYLVAVLAAQCQRQRMILPVPSNREMADCANGRHGDRAVE